MTDIRILQMLDEACQGDFGVLGRLWRSKWREVSLEDIFEAEPLDVEALRQHLERIAPSIDRYRRQDSRLRDRRREGPALSRRNPFIDEMPWCSISGDD